MLYPVQALSWIESAHGDKHGVVFQEMYVH